MSGNGSTHHVLHAVRLQSDRLLQAAYHWTPNYNSMVSREVSAWRCERTRLCVARIRRRIVGEDCDGQPTKLQHDRVERVDDQTGEGHVPTAVFPKGEHSIIVAMSVQSASKASSSPASPFQCCCCTSTPPSLPRAVPCLVPFPCMRKSMPGRPSRGCRCRRARKMTFANASFCCVRIVALCVAASLFLVGKHRQFEQRPEHRSPQSGAHRVCLWRHKEASLPRTSASPCPHHCHHCPSPHHSLMSSITHAHAAHCSWQSSSRNRRSMSISKAATLSRSVDRSNLSLPLPLPLCAAARGALARRASKCGTWKQSVRLQKCAPRARDLGTCRCAHVTTLGSCQRHVCKTDWFVCLELRQANEKLHESTNTHARKGAIPRT